MQEKKRKRGVEDRTKMFDIYLLGILEGGKGKME